MSISVFLMNSFIRTKAFVLHKEIGDMNGIVSEFKFIIASLPALIYEGSFVNLPKFKICLR